MEKLTYKNPILHMDFSDPDAIRVGEDFFMISSSFNQLPGIPVLHSKNLVEWKIVNYVYEKLPFEKFNNVCHGDGSWAPSIRYHNGTYYVTIPFPDEGIYVSETKDPFGEWSELRPLIQGSGYEDPCPIWTEDGRCYVVMGFIKNKIGFNSELGVCEVTPDLTKVIEDYKIVYDGHDGQPIIEGPKFHYINGYYYIMAPAGSVKTGWQTCLRSKNIYGPYEVKIVLIQNDSLTNGPHQGALIDLDDEGKNWAFIHFQDKRPYGRIVHLEPVTWANDWPFCGKTDCITAGSPVDEGEYPINVKTDFEIKMSNDFTTGKLLPVWQSPANKTKEFYSIDENGLRLNALKNDKPNELNLYPNLLSQMVAYKEFNIGLLVDVSNLEDGDSFSFTVTGKKYTYIEIKKEIDSYKCNFYKGEFKKNDILVSSYILTESTIKISGVFTNSNLYDLDYDLYVNNQKINCEKLKACAGTWIGTRLGICAYSNRDSKGYALVKYFNQEKI